MGNIISNENDENTRTLTKVPKYLQPNKGTFKKPNSRSMTQLNVPEKNCQSLVQKASESDLKFRWSQGKRRVNIDVNIKSIKYTHTLF